MLQLVNMCARNISWHCDSNRSANLGGTVPDGRGSRPFFPSPKPIETWSLVSPSLATGGAATLEFNGEQLAVQAVPTTDALSIERASQEFLSKYRSSPYAASIVRPEVLETTLRLDSQ